MTSVELKQQWIDTNSALEASVRRDHESGSATRHTNALRKRLGELARLQYSAEVREAVQAFIAEEQSA